MQNKICFGLFYSKILNINELKVLYLKNKLNKNL